MLRNHQGLSIIPGLAHGLVWFAMLVLCTASSAQPATRSNAVACVSCVILHVPLTAAATLSQLPAGALEGMTIAVNATDSATDRLFIDRVRATGAIPGLLLVATSSREPSPELGTAAVLILTDVGVSDDAIFQVRTLVTAVRAVAPGVRILIAAQTVPERLSGYVDGRVEPGRRLSSATVDALIDVSLKGESVPVLVRIDDIDPQVLAAFASQRALTAEVSAAAALTVQEIVARHQAERRRQEQLVHRTIARGTTSLVFEVPGFVAPVAITAQTTIYAQAAAQYRACRRSYRLPACC